MGNVPDFDCNKVAKSGIYGLSSASITNGPLGAFYGMLIEFRAIDQVRYQLAVDCRAGSSVDLWSRSYWQSGWSGWKKVTFGTT